MAIAWASSWKVLVAKLNIATVLESLDFTCINGISAVSAETVLALLVSSRVNAFLLIILSKTLVINASVSILTLESVSANSTSITSAIDEK